METKFQTSFIPKKPMMSPGGGLSPSTQHHGGTSFFMTIAVLAFIISIGAAGGMYFWKSYLERNQIAYKEQLAKREEQFKPDLIEDIKRWNVKIDLAKQLIDNHIAVSQIFDILGRMTIEKVRFTSLDLTVGSAATIGGKASTANSNEVRVSMNGYGTSLPAVAWQSDVLAKLERYGLRKVIKNPVLSDPALDKVGLVSFGFTATIDPANLSYKKSLLGPEVEAEAESSAPSSTLTQ